MMAPICQVSGPSCEQGPARPDQRPTSGAEPTPHASHPLPSCLALRAGQVGVSMTVPGKAPPDTHMVGGVSLPESNPNGDQEAAGHLQTAGGHGWEAGGKEAGVVRGEVQGLLGTWDHNQKR